MPGPSSSCVPCSTTPPGAYRPSPISRCGRCCLQARQYLGHPETYFFRGTYPRPTRSRAYASPNPLPSPAQGSLPAGRAHPFAGRGSHPLDDKQGFMVSSHTPILLDQPCLVAPKAGIQGISPNTDVRQRSSYRQSMVRLSCGPKACREPGGARVPRLASRRRIPRPR